MLTTRTIQTRQYHCLSCPWSGEYVNFKDGNRVCPLCDSEVVRIDKVNKKRKKIIEINKIKLEGEDEREDTEL